MLRNVRKGNESGKVRFAAASGEETDKAAEPRQFVSLLGRSRLPSAVGNRNRGLMG